MKILLFMAWLHLLKIMPKIRPALERSKFNNSPCLPEPMEFDLVLPLGEKNEYEFNTLFQYDFEDDTVLMNPEFEYADGVFKKR